MFYKALSSPCLTEENVQFRFSRRRDFELISVLGRSNATSCSTVSDNVDKPSSHLGGRGPLVHFVADLGDHGAVRHSGGGALWAKQHAGRLYSVKYQSLSGHYIFSFTCFFFLTFSGLTCLGIPPSLRSVRNTLRFTSRDGDQRLSPQGSPSLGSSPCSWTPSRLPHVRVWL